MDKLKLLLLLSISSVNGENSLFGGLVQGLEVLERKSYGIIIIKASIFKNFKNDVDDLYAIVTKAIVRHNSNILPDCTEIQENQGMKKADLIFIITDAYEVVS